ncbi:hypothetical protein [Aliiruegeria lutimaris]|uniref:Hpr(Ser) kinase/phosphatase n=1 Tax=Aliiruegeria lutimaris TaxID=571298 RepID=A0A1G9PJM9_9RHOB|nr:hypothetical protein [Aliiruegeria lutimaris]SDL98701.1 hypothetical protein SAMN04488026_11424 [Aliiruegeria lutimaris]
MVDIATSPDDWRAALLVCAPSIERVPLGDRYILYSAASGAILTTDDVGLAIVSDVVAPSGKAACLPPEIIDAVLRAWETAGLFNDVQLPFPDPVTDDGHSVQYRREYATEWGALSVETDDAILANQLEKLFWAFASPVGMPLGSSARIRCVSCDGNGLGVFRDGQALWGRASINAARYLILREMAEALCGADRVGAVLHGAAVLGRAGALLILGDSGRGKSTLAQGLIDAGCGFLADDHLPLHVDGDRLFAFPTGSAIKNGARDLVEVRRLMALHGDCRSERNGVSYVPIAPAVAPGTSVPLAAVVFPEFVSDADAHMTQMGRETAFIEAIASGSRPSRHRAQIAPLVKLFATVPAYALRYGTSAQSVEACLELLDA